MCNKSDVKNLLCMLLIKYSNSINSLVFFFGKSYINNYLLYTNTKIHYIRMINETEITFNAYGRQI